MNKTIIDNVDVSTCEYFMENVCLCCKNDNLRKCYGVDCEFKQTHIQNCKFLNSMGFCKLTNMFCDEYSKGCKTKLPDSLIKDCNRLLNAGAWDTFVKVILDFYTQNNIQLLEDKVIYEISINKNIKEVLQQIENHIYEYNKNLYKLNIVQNNTSKYGITIQLLNTTSLQDVKSKDVVFEMLHYDNMTYEDKKASYEQLYTNLLKLTEEQKILKQTLRDLYEKHNLPLTQDIINLLQDEEQNG